MGAVVIAGGGAGPSGPHDKSEDFRDEGYSQLIDAKAKRAQPAIKEVEKRKRHVIGSRVAWGDGQHACKSLFSPKNIKEKNLWTGAEKLKFHGNGTNNNCHPHVTIITTIVIL